MILLLLLFLLVVVVVFICCLLLRQGFSVQQLWLSRSLICGSSALRFPPSSATQVLELKASTTNTWHNRLACLRLFSVFQYSALHVGLFLLRIHLISGELTGTLKNMIQSIHKPV